MMRIGLITDTHIWGDGKLPAEVANHFRGVDLILHGGDIYSHTVLDELEQIAPVLAALGDDDYPSPDPRVQEKHILTLEGHAIWLIHEGPSLPISSTWLPTWCRNRLTSHDVHRDTPNIIISGHEHKVVVERSPELLFINSGSATLLHYQKGVGTLGILELNNGAAVVRIIELQKC
jgi:putative phosphoesterase